MNHKVHTVQPYHIKGNNCKYTSPVRKVLALADDRTEDSVMRIISIVMLARSFFGAEDL